MTGYYDLAILYFNRNLVLKTIEVVTTGRSEVVEFILPEDNFIVGFTNNSGLCSHSSMTPKEILYSFRPNIFLLSDDNFTKSERVVSLRLEQLRQLT